jgi:hypothetical protein
MSLNDSAYDLGDLDLPAPRARRARRSASAAAPTAVAPSGILYAPIESREGSHFNLPGSLSLFLPGSGQLLAGDWLRALFFVSSLGFLVTFSWALLSTMDRLAPTLVLLGQSRATGVWALGAAYGLAGLLHLAAVLTAGQEIETRRAGYRVSSGIAAFASALIPGWGQILNGHRLRAAAFLAGLWLCGLAWLLVSAPVQDLLARFDLVLPGAWSVIGSTAFRWTAPAVLWALAIYDAAQGNGQR